MCIRPLTRPGLDAAREPLCVCAPIMRVLMFGWEFPPFYSGGLGVACRGLTRALSHQDVDVTFVLPKPMRVVDGHMRFVFAQGLGTQGTPDGTVTYSSGVRERTVDVLLNPYLSVSEYEHLRSTLGNRTVPGMSPHCIYASDLFGEVARYAIEADRIAREEDFDVIHAHDWLAFPAGVAAKRATGKPLVVHVHLPAVDMTGGNGYDQRIFDVEAEGFAAADVIVAISQRVKDSIVTHHHIDPRKIVIVYNGIDPDDVASPGAQVPMHPLRREGHPFALYLGRLTMFKGPDKFLEAAALTAREYSDARFVMAGGGEAERLLKQQAHHLGIADKTIFAGFVRGKERDALFANANVFVMPSLTEPFGLVALESLALGTPAIVSKQSGASEIIKNALKVDFWDVEELANKMLAVMKYKPLAKQLREKGSKEARSFTWDKPAQECVDIYRQLVAV